MGKIAEIDKFSRREQQEVTVGKPGSTLTVRRVEVDGEDRLQIEPEGHEPFVVDRRLADTLADLCIAFTTV